MIYDEGRVGEETKPGNSKDQIPPEVEDKPISLDELDQLLSQEDPGFSSEFSVLQGEKFEVDIEVEEFSEVELSQAAPTAPASTNNFFGDWKKNSVSAVSGAISRFFNFIGSFFSMSHKEKLTVISVVVLAIAAVMILNRAFNGSFLPSFELKFLSSFNKIADRTFKIEQGEQFEDFDNPLRHPNFIVLIERLVVNLKPADANENPMGMFEFYIEASSQEGAIEINERQQEIRDLMARTLETATYEELATADGKEKMKLALRREINTLLTEGRVRRVFFKTIILKPE